MLIKTSRIVEISDKTYTKEGDTVLDFASGSMSTAIACIHTNRKCICIERMICTSCGERKGLEMNII